jgi:nicotinamide-nucleotide amidase
MRAEIIATGSELLSGGVLDTNSLFLSEELLALGIETAFKTVVGDNEKDMEDATRRALARTDAVFITGGIGPTEDDITRKVVAKITKKRLVLNEDALAAIKAVLASRKKEYLSANDRQALTPAGARIIANPVGVAPGFYLDEDGKFLAVLPGVPEEMRAMFSAGLKQVLEERFEDRMFLRRRILRTCGMSESAVNQAIQDVMKRGKPAVGLTAKPTGVDIRIMAREAGPERSQAAIEKTEAEIRERLGDAVYGVDDQELEEIVGALLKQRGQKLSIAESCTGGLIGARITNVAGSSEYFEHGVVVYSSRSKTELLGVPAETIERHGAVSREAAGAMALGVRQAGKTDLGLAVTGIAGPGGGTPEKPVGLVYIALASSSGVKVDEQRFLGNRDQVRTKAAQTALDMVRRHLIG